MIAPTVDEFKTYFSRDFPYGVTTDYVTDADITRAIAESLFMINSDLFDNQTGYVTAYYYLAAHNLVMNLKNSSQGLSSSFSWPESSKSVGSVSQGLSIPEEILSNPAYSMLTKTGYGAKYLSIVIPLLHGNVQIGVGWTQG